MSKSYRTYATERTAAKRLRALRAQYPQKIFQIMVAPDQSFRFAVAMFCEPNHWAYCA